MSDIVVTLHDGTELPARVVSYDEHTDLAIVQIQGTDKRSFPTVELGTSKNLRPGEWAIAVGSPLALSHSVTAGIVSAVGRRLPGEFETDYIQVDTMVESGNSGGPLLNADGQVIGVTSMKIQGISNGYLGTTSSSFGLAIPIDAAKEILNQLATKRRVARPFLGFSSVPLDPPTIYHERRRNQQFTAQNGLLVTQVGEATPASSAGLRPGDVILSVNGKKISTFSDFRMTIGWEAGTALELQVARRGQTDQTFSTRLVTATTIATSSATPPSTLI